MRFIAALVPRLAFTTEVEVVHLDGARAAVGRARANAALSGLADAPVRWVAEDALTFVRRAANRGERSTNRPFRSASFWKKRGWRNPN